MSASLLRQTKIVPRLVYEVSDRFRSIQVWTTPCIVTRFGKTTALALPPSEQQEGGNGSSSTSILINPSNPELSGCRNFPYFPRGGPVPVARVDSMHKDWQPLGFVSQWGGMEVGDGMLFPVSVVDGLVHQLGGWSLQAELAIKRLSTKQPCPVGTACRTSAGNGTLREHYDAIVHTTPPFYKQDADPEVKLQQCYQSALKLAFDNLDGNVRVAVPLLGAGARGFPTSVAIDIAAKAAVEWHQSPDENASSHAKYLVFGLQEGDQAQALKEAIELHCITDTFPIQADEATDSLRGHG